ncbi:hypothetical protein BT69DRAFT_1221553 [Atractiella rhizophila]|nr:hypothetical protein BT69DRAFT_1221553 [Atractiella rhizophila]
MSDILSRVLRGGKTLYYLTHSDFKTVMLPVLAFTIAVAWHGFARFAASALWLYLLLIEWSLANQTSGNALIEDVLNKSYRPIPAGLITLKMAKRLRWFMPVLNLVQSYILGGRLTVYASMALSIIVFVHNDLELSSQFWSKNFLAAATFPGMEIGCIAVSCASLSLGEVSASDSIYSPEDLDRATDLQRILLTSIHVQDLPDVIGDAAAGRKTLPIVFPRAARMSIPIILSLASTGAILISDAHEVLVWLTIAFGAITSLRYLLVREPKREMLSYGLYNVGLTQKFNRF